MEKQDVLIDTDMGNDDIVAIAMLLLSPKINVKEISVISGVSSLTRGMVNLYQILNYCEVDVPIINIVFNSGIPIMIVGIDVTSNFPVTKKLVDRIKGVSASNSLSLLIKEIILNNKSDFNYFYDPLPAYILINPNKVTSKIKCAIRVKQNSKEFGKMILISQNKKNVELIMRINQKGFYKYLVNSVKGGYN